MSVPVYGQTAATTFLDLEEITGQPAQRVTDPTSELTIDAGTTIRHSGWRVERTKVFEAMLELGFSNSRIARFSNCGAAAWLMVRKDDPSKFRVAANTCKDRFCKVCQSSRTERIAANLSEQLEEGFFRFVTLTVRSTEQTLEEQLDHLYDSFKRLRRSKWWKSRVDGGVAFLEITFNHRSNQWHPHLHCVVSSSFLQQQELSQHWHVASKDSFIVDVRAIRNRHHVARYVVKYATKPIPAKVVFEKSRLTEMMRALTGRRLILSFGNWQNLSLTDCPDSEGWECLMSLDVLFDNAKAGDEWAQKVIASLTTPSAYDGRLPENFSP